MSQVKNLRAMFEHKGPSSPPERGREGTPSQGDSPRPLSRVRTNFVTVEKDGRVGLQRDTSSDSVPTLSRTLSAGTEGDVPTPTTSQTALPEAKAKSDDAKQLFVVAQTPKRVPSAIPEEATPVTPVKIATPLVAVANPALGATPKVSVPALFATADLKASGPTAAIAGKEQQNKTASSAATPSERSPVRKLFTKAPSKPVETEHATPSVVKKSAEAPANGAARLRMANTQNGAANGASKDKADASKAASSAAAITSSIPMRSKIPSAASAPKDTTKTATKAPSAGKSLPKAISTAKATAKTTTTSSGLKVKTPTSPSKPLTPRLAAAKTASDSKKTSASTVAEKKSTPATSAAPKGAAGKKPPSIQTFPPNGIGFVKPKPKSPTRPVQLPSSLTTHTASSATKTRQSLSRQSGNFLAVHGASQASATRSLSRASVATIGPTSTKIKPLRRQSSTIGPQRPSIGPPPKQPARDHPVIKKERAIDEGFLERMMRPTQSFACKTADKVHQSPPRSSKSRESYGSNRSTTSSTRHVKEKITTPPKTVSTDEAGAVSTAPAVVEPVENVAVATLPMDEHEHEPEAVAVEEVEVEAVDTAPSEDGELNKLDESAAPAEAAETVEAPKAEEIVDAADNGVDDEAAVVEEAEAIEDAETAETADDNAEAEISEGVAGEAPVEEETAGDAVVEEAAAEETAEELVEAPVAAEEKAVGEDVAEEEATPTAEVAEEEAVADEAAPEATPEVSIEAASGVDEAATEPEKEVVHIDVAEIEDSDAAVEDEAKDKATHTESPAAATEL